MKPACFTPRLGPGWMRLRRDWIVSARSLDSRSCSFCAMSFKIKPRPPSCAASLLLSKRTTSFSIFATRRSSSVFASARKYVSKPRAAPGSFQLGLAAFTWIEMKRSPFAWFAILSAVAERNERVGRARHEDAHAARLELARELLRDARA